MKRLIRCALFLVGFVCVAGVSKAGQSSNDSAPSARAGKSNPQRVSPNDSPHSPNIPQVTSPKSAPVAQVDSPQTKSPPAIVADGNDKKASSDWWLVCFTGALVFVGVCQIIAMLRQEKWMRKNVTVARDSADAAFLTVKVMKKNVNGICAPWFLS